MSPNRPRASWLLACPLALLLAAAPMAGAAVVFDNFDPGDTFSPTNNLFAAYAQRMLGSVVAVRAAARFTVTGGDYTLDSITLPISQQISGAIGNFLRVRLTTDAAGAPGANLETLTEDQPLWPLFSNPFTTKTTVGSANHPLLAGGSSYWIVTELSALPGGDPSTVDYRWFENVGGTTVEFRQQQATGDLPMNPWTGSDGPQPAAFRVDGTNAVGVGAQGPAPGGLEASPTPFRSSTSLRFGLARAQRVELAVYDLHGARVRTLERGERAAGAHETAWNGRDDAGREVPSGVYLVRLVTEDGRSVRRVVRIE